MKSNPILKSLKIPLTLTSVVLLVWLYEMKVSLKADNKNEIPLNTNKNVIPNLIYNQTPISGAKIAAIILNAAIDEFAFSK